MRCFVAVDLEQSLRQKIVKLQQELVGFDVKLVESQNLHFTLKFLGEVNEKIIGKVKNNLRHLADSTHGFDITLQSVGAFSRVIWVGAPFLHGLQVSVNESLADLFTREKPSPHLTIARVRSQKHKKEIVGFLEKHRNEIIGSMTVDSIKLKKSTLTTTGPVYEDIEVFKLVV